MKTSPAPAGRLTRIALAVGAATLAAGAMAPALASSHREAPFITTKPKVDGTDFYMFTSYEPGRADYVTFVADYQPLEPAYGGPNYFQMDPEAVYDIHIDNNGDAHEDITFRFKFTNSLKGITLPIGNVMPFRLLVNLKRKVMFSTASPSVSRWIS